MNFRKYIVLFLGCGIGAILGVVGLIFLVKSISDHANAKSELKACSDRIVQLNHEMPFLVERMSRKSMLIFAVSATSPIKYKFG